MEEGYEMSLHVCFHSTALSICQLPQGSKAPVDILEHPFAAFFRTHDEVTLVCPTDLVPQNVRAEHGFIPFELVGPFEFGLTGILTQVANPLAAAGVSIVPLSTFNTDYALIKAEQRENPIEALRRAGHTAENTAKPALPTALSYPGLPYGKRRNDKVNKVQFRSSSIAFHVSGGQGRRSAGVGHS
jgi:hypothetical protein